MRVKMKFEIYIHLIS